MKLYKKIYTLYLLSPSCFVLYFSMYLNSSLRKFWGDTFFITATEKLFIENCWPCTSFACIDRADLSHFSSQKHCRWPLVRLCDSWVVRPKYASGPEQSLHIQRYTIFLDLQLSDFGMVTGILLTIISFWLMTAGHWRQPPLLHRWPVEVTGKLNCLSLTIALPIEFRFFIASMIRTSPINVWNSVLRLLITSFSWLTPLK